MTKPATQGERLTRIETLLETIIKGDEDRRKSMHDKIEEMAADIKAIKSDVSADKAELAALKNKGAGILIGVGLAGGSIGAGVIKLLEWFK